MEELGVVERNGRYEYENLPDGVNEAHGLDFHSPYGCSKGAADQYVRDYSRIYGLKTAVLRQSCIYGTRQFGIEDQGWVAWFTIASILDKPLTIYGDGKQGRDLLWIDDLVDAYIELYKNADDLAGGIFNVGGGPGNVLSLLELVDMLRSAGVLRREPAFSEWREGDQKIFVCDTRKMANAIRWQPRTSPAQGVARLIEWTAANKELLARMLG
jgi:CDP-paratose 2-epimerase